MATVRRGARGFLKYLIPLVLLLVLVQIFLAGFGIFGLEEGEALDDVETLELHRGVGHLLGTFGGILIFLASLIWWPRDKRLLGWFVLTAVLLFVQPIFAVIGGEFVGGIHALNAMVLVGLLGRLSYLLWRGRAAVASETI